MKVYTCNVWDGIRNEEVDLGVFSTKAKALEAGGLYIAENACGNAHLLDWDEYVSYLIYWYQDDQYNPFTRTVIEWEVDSQLA